MSTPEGTALAFFIGNVTGFIACLLCLSWIAFKTVVTASPSSSGLVGEASSVEER